MILQTGLLQRVTEQCIEAAIEASDARNSDFAALVGCHATPGQSCATDFTQQGDEFRGLADRLQRVKLRIGDMGETIDRQEQQCLRDDLRMVLTAIRVAAFDIGLHGRSGNLTDTEIADELGAYARLDYEVRGNVIPWLKAELGIVETKAL